MEAVLMTRHSGVVAMLDDGTFSVWCICGWNGGTFATWELADFVGQHHASLTTK
jgi:hypothetical protein